MLKQNWTGDDLDKLLTNPAYAGIGKYSRVYSDRLWIQNADYSLQPDKLGAGFWDKVQENVISYLHLPKNQAAALCAKTRAQYDAAQNQDERYAALTGIAGGLAGGGGMKTFEIVLLCLFVAVILTYVGFNVNQIMSLYTFQRENFRLKNAAPDTKASTSPAVSDDFSDTLSTGTSTSGLSPAFWDFTFINGAGKISHDSFFHAAGYSVQDHALVITHTNDPDFDHENSNVWSAPAAGQYNNVTLIGASGFLPRPGVDIVARFGMKAGDPFYGSAGVIFQPVGTIGKDGAFVKPFDQAGIAVIGPESSMRGYYGGVFAYTALDWVPGDIKHLLALDHAWHDYEIRLRWDSAAQWTEIVSVDGTKSAEIAIPPLGPVQIQVWSDNYLIALPSRRWWEVFPTARLGFQNGGDKTFYLRSIQVGEIQ